jgi:hypothetical protein
MDDYLVISVGVKRAPGQSVLLRHNSLALLQSFQVTQTSGGWISRYQPPFTLQSFVDNSSTCSFWTSYTAGTVTGRVTSTTWGLDYQGQSSAGSITMHLHGSVSQ